MKKNSFKMELIETREQLLENIATLKKYLIGNNQNNKAFAFGIIQNGRNFFVIQEEDRSFSFFPSRFIGYKGNTRENMNGQNQVAYWMEKKPVLPLVKF